MRTRLDGRPTTAWTTSSTDRWEEREIRNGKVGAGVGPVQGEAQVGRFSLKGGTGLLAKRDFLEGTDHRRFEIERDARNAEQG